MKSANFCMFALHSFWKVCDWAIASLCLWIIFSRSFCLWSIFSRLSSRRQIVEIESLSFCTVLESSLVVVIELVSLELEATDAQVLLLVMSEFQVFWLDVSERVSTECIAYCSSGSSSVSNTIVVLNRTPRSNVEGVSSCTCFPKVPYIFGRLSCSHFVVDWKFASLVYTFHLPDSIVFDVERTSRISFFFIRWGFICTMALPVIP